MKSFMREVLIITIATTLTYAIVAFIQALMGYPS